MNNKSLLETLKTYQYELIDDVITLKAKNYLFFYCVIKTGIKHTEALGIILNKPLLDKDKIKELSNRFNKYGKIYYDNLVLVQDMIYITFKENKQLFDKLTVVVDYLNEIDITYRDKCIICGSKADYHAYHGFLAPIHTNCLEKVKTKEKIENNKKQSNTLAYIFATLGALIGVLPILIIYLLSNALVVLLSFLAPVFACYGFVLGKGKRTTLSDIYTIVISFVFVILMDVFFISNQINIIEGINNLSEYVQNYLSTFLNVIIQSVLFVALGYISSWLFYKNRGFKKEKRT